MFGATKDSMYPTEGRKKIKLSKTKGKNGKKRLITIFIYILSVIRVNSIIKWQQCQID